jgi:hypothetical protein
MVDYVDYRLPVGMLLASYDIGMQLFYWREIEYRYCYSVLPVQSKCAIVLSFVIRSLLATLFKLKLKVGPSLLELVSSYNATLLQAQIYWTKD